MSLATICKHSDELGLDFAKTQAAREQKLDRFWAHLAALLHRKTRCLKPQVETISPRAPSSQSLRWEVGDWLFAGVPPANVPVSIDCWVEEKVFHP
jgi:hypothetical protein